jgi:hypothetical protein
LKALEIPKTLLVVYALSELGGEADVEHVAVKAHELFPQQFCWKSFPQFPDKDAVRVHLSEAKKATFGQLVTDRDLRHEKRGDAGYTKRYALTEAGIRRAAEVRQAVGGGEVKATHNSLEYKRLIEPIIESEAFKLYRSGTTYDGIGRDRFLLGVKLFGDSSEFVITGRFARVMSAVERLPYDNEKTELLEFLRGGRNAFGI